MNRFAHRLQQVARREEGMALVLALVCLVVMAILMASMLAYSSATARDSYLKRSDQNAYSLAEAGLNQGIAQLASHYYNSSNATNNTSTSFATDWISGGTTSQQSPTNSAACTATSTCMSWSLTSCAFYSAVTGCSVLSGSSGNTKGTIVLKGTGTVPNPTGAGRALVTTVSASVDVTQAPKLVPTPAYWNEIYSGTPASAGCDVTFGQGVSITAPVYVAGNLCLTQTAQITGSSNLKVLGWLSLKNSSFVGQNGSPIASAQIGGGCPNGASSSGCTVNKNGGPVWDSAPTTQHAAVVPAADPLPAVDWAYMQTAQANSNPAASCTGGKSFSDANFDLTPSFNYSCTSSLGSITYTTGSPNTLVVSGLLYFANNLTLSGQTTKYSGNASIFVNGSLTSANNANLCVAIASGNCDFANANNSASANYWDTTAKVLIIQARGAITATNLHYQGGLYSDTSINLGGGQSQTQGPLVTPGPITVGQQLSGSFPSFPLVQAGSLGTPPPPFTLGKPYGGSF